MTILPKAIYMFNTIPSTILMTFFTEIEKSTLKYIWKHERPQIDKAILSKKYNTGSITIPDFKLCYRVIIINIAWYWQKTDRKTNGSRRKDADINSCIYSQQYSTNLLMTHYGEKIASSANVAEKTVYSHVEDI
jgi:hypothetical protein